MGDTPEARLVSNRSSLDSAAGLAQTSARHMRQSLSRGRCRGEEPLGRRPVPGGRSSIDAIAHTYVCGTVSMRVARRQGRVPSFANLESCRMPLYVCCPGAWSLPEKRLKAAQSRDEHGPGTSAANCSAA